jgi:Pathogenicity locus
MADSRSLAELISIGPAMLRDFEILGVRSVPQLARQTPERLYEKLCRVAPQHQDICCLDIFRAAVAQACDPQLPAEQCRWWYWSRKRKEKLTKRNQQFARTVR